MRIKRKQPTFAVLFITAIALLAVATACTPTPDPAGSSGLVSADERAPTDSVGANPGDSLGRPEHTAQSADLNSGIDASAAGAANGAVETATPSADLASAGEAVVPEGLYQPLNPLVTITVNSTSDVVNPSDGLCTLREAIRAANSDTASGPAVGECPAGSGADTITFSVTGSVVSAGGTLQINDALSILGPGARQLTIDGSRRRVFKVSSGVTFSLQDVTITNGGSGGATSVSFGGGAIWNDRGALSVTNVTFFANTSGGVGSGHGGAIANGGALIVRNSTFFNNVSPERGGAIFNFAGTDDAGIVYEGSALIVNSTVFSNTALTSRGGGIDNQDGLLGVINSTIVGNHADASSGGGIDNSSRGEVTLRNTIVANNTALNGANCRNGGTLYDLSGNLSFPDTTCPGINANPNLGPLQNNGGPTDSLALQPGSAAIDAGIPAGADCTDHLGNPLPTDQRGSGFLRRVDGNDDGIATCDIGAYEAGPSLADLSIYKFSLLGGVKPGGLVAYTIVVSNSSPVAVAASVTDTFPAEYDVSGWVCAPASACLPSSGTGDISATVTLPPLGSVAFTVQGKVVPTATGTLINTATVAPPPGVTDPNPANNSSTDRVPITPVDLVVGKDDGQTTVKPGDVLTYVLTISNTTVHVAAGVAVTDTLPLNTTFLTASDGGSAVGGIVTWPLFDLPPSSSVTRTLTVQVDDPFPRGVDTITNTVTAVADFDSNGPDPTPANNSATDVDAIVFECELYPIALHTSSLTGVPVDQVVPDILNGTQPGNFGWLSWAGNPDVGALVTSLTPPGDSDTFVNPGDPGDHKVSIGDWVQGKPGVSNSGQVRAALDTLKMIEIVVPVWDIAQGAGSNTSYHVMKFAWVRLTDYQLPAQNRISARFLGFVRCAD